VQSAERCVYGYVCEPVQFVAFGGSVDNNDAFSLSFKSDALCDVLQQKLSLVIDM
jgi:hypothetical protein